MTAEQDFERSWRRRFEHFAEVHDDDARIAGWSNSGLTARMRAFLRSWQRTPEASSAGVRWLDAGAGAGTYTRFLCADGRHVTAIDYSLPTVRKAQERAPRDVEWLVADVTSLPFADASFDGVVCFGVMQALSAPNDALRELRRVLAPGGVLWIDALNSRCLAATFAEARRRKRGLPPHLRYDEPEAFAAVLRDSGFRSIDVHWAPIVPSRLRILQPVVDTTMVTTMLNAIPRLAARLSHSILLRAQSP
jgi:ubiquinone/menaquinone biosynthesis C-methylase UbiE